MRPSRLGFLVLGLLALATQADALDGVYIGGRLGHVGLTGNLKAANGNALGYGVDLGLRTNSFLDVTVSLTRSSHNALTLTSLCVSADLELIPLGDFAFYLGLGPGFYFYRVASDTATKFGIHGGFGGDLFIEDNIRLGLGVRWHGVFSENVGDSFWTAMFRFGYVFGA